MRVLRCIVSSCLPDGGFRRIRKEDPLMTKLLTTLGLYATAFAALAALAPRPAAATPSIPIPPPHLIAPDLRSIKPLPLPRLALFPLRAELTAQVIEKPTGIPGWSWVICVVRNTGLKNSGP